MKRTAYIVFLTAMLLGGITAFAGDTIHTSKFDGTQRSYRMHIPDALPSDAPLVVVLHGYGSGAKHRPVLDSIADAEGFAVCYPEGSKNSRGKRCWNVGYPVQADMKVDDVKFLRKLCLNLQNEYGLSKSNTFCIGMSNGGEMCYLLSYTAPGLFAAVASVAGLTLEWMYDKFDGNAVPLLEIHGTEDRTSEWNGDLENRGGWGAYIPVPIAVSYWAAMNKTTRMESTAIKAKNPDNGHSVIFHRYYGGKNEVWLYEVIGGGHSWSTDDLDTENVIWNFFKLNMDRPRR